MDGITASRRLATLLAMNSLVLKQASPHLEWYYRAIKPCVHYLPFWQHNETDVLPLIEALRHPENQRVAQRIAANGQAFAMLHLTEEARWRYLQLLIDQYAALYRGSTSGTAVSTAGGSAGGSTNNTSAAAKNSSDSAAIVNSTMALL